MKNLLQIAAFLGLIITYMACTSETLNVLPTENDTLQMEVAANPCVNDDPITRVVNNGTTSFDLNVLNAEGIVVVSILDIPANSTTSWVSFSEGEVLFSVSTNTAFVNDDKVVLQMNPCMAYEIEIDANNAIVSYTPTIL